MSQKNINQQALIERLKDDAQADAYFYEVLEHCKKTDLEHAQEQLIVAFKNITQAQGGVANWLPESGAQSFYRVLASVILKCVR